MSGALAGVFDPRAAQNSIAARAAIARSLDVHPSDVAAWQGLLIGRTPTRPPGEAGGTTCLLLGSVDNLKSLRREGGRRSAASDEEALSAAASREQPEALLAGLHGTFCLVLWDDSRAAGLIAVDALGSQAIFLAVEGGRLWFASELPTLLQLLPRTPGPDPAAAAHWAADGYLERGQTLYEGVRRLEGGHFVELSAGAWAKRAYWSPRFTGVLDLTDEDLASHLRAQLVGAVGRRLVRNGTVGILTSGGLDSTSVAAAATRAATGSKSRIRCYSTVFPAFPEMDESDLIDETTARLDLSTTKLEFHGGSMLRGGLEFLRAWQEPALSPNLVFGLPMLRLAATDGVDCVLDGEGGDGLFGAVPFVLADHLRRGRFGSAIRAARQFPGLGAAPEPALMRAVMRQYGILGLLPRATHRAARKLRDPHRYAPPWLTSRAARAYVANDQWQWKELDGPLWWRHLADLLTVSRERMGAYDFLRRRAALAGVRHEHPLLADRQLVEFALRLPPSSRHAPLHDRPLLRKAMSGVLPTNVLTRTDKADFTGLFRATLTGSDFPLIRRLLEDPAAEINQFARADVIREQILDKIPRGHGGRWCWTVWRLVNIECWLRQCSDESFCDRILAEWQLEQPRLTVRRDQRTAPRAGGHEAHPETTAAGGPIS